jgi:HEAT repeat protein
LAKEIHFAPEKAWDKRGAAKLVRVLARNFHDKVGKEKALACIRESREYVETETVAEALKDYLASAEIGLRRGAAETLGELGGKPAVPSLIEAMDKEDDFFVRTAMRDALTKITGERYKLTEAQKYREWWGKNK